MAESSRRTGGNNRGLNTAAAVAALVAILVAGGVGAHYLIGLDYGSGQVYIGPHAGVNFTQSGPYSVMVTLTSEGNIRPESVRAHGCKSNSGNITAVGDNLTVGNCTYGNHVVVTARTRRGNHTGVIARYYVAGYGHF